ncbi:rhodanese-like domain-containing protein [Erythrobacter dokdonensis]|uniref:Rhodanese-like protein n=1 Tax=Erythrobacter dokdonensis DSW-74 TaxID=1300349 RepID=A0A1A7BF25_9SPHN|nr:rhodanese-like domain-containing protein [Erythrobacter dokdonensis]OBV11089.1 Rhodanese-like protein [Erythrobacter dokdonensis DSW-74]
MRGRAIIAGAVATLALISAASAGEPQPPSAGPALFDAQGYRTSRYRNPIKADPAPAAVIELAAALALEPGKEALFMDVMPVEGGVRDPVTGVWTLSREHLTIPGALWYPETGRAPVDETLWQALEAKVAEVRRQAPRLPVVLFCRSDCWMSWNAARRLAERGHDNIHWLAEGTDGWHAAGRGLVAATPVAIPATRQQERND